MTRPELNEVSLDETMNKILTGEPIVVITMSPGQWDGFLQSGYDFGHTLLEVNKNEEPTHAYRKLDQ